MKHNQREGMMAVLRISIASGLAIAITVGACSDASKQPTAPQATTASPAPKSAPLDLSTPDRAIKSIWAAADVDREQYCDATKRMNADPDPKVQAWWHSNPSYGVREDALTGRAAKAWKDLEAAASTCVVETFSREIKEVKTETDSRAVVIAQIKNITPIPAGAEAEDWILKERELGTEYRYVFTKIGDRWKVEDVLERNTLTPIPETVFPDSKPYPAYRTEAF